MKGRSLSSGRRGQSRKIGGEREGSKKYSDINILEVRGDHDCVLFVQHRSKNGRIGTFIGRSFVACSDVLGNSPGSDGGGHPEVVPLGGSLKSLALCGSVRRRERLKRFSQGLRELIFGCITQRIRNLP